ncbi:MAG: penicillin-binding protein 2, partial [Flavobacteriales bacterium]
MSFNVFSSRFFIVVLLMTTASILLLVNMFQLQVLSPEYKDRAEKNVIKKETIYPARGSVYDRHGKLLVGNQRAYDLMVVPNLVEQLDTLLLAERSKTSIERLRKRLKQAKRYSRHLPSILVKGIEKETGMLLLESIHRFEGIYLEERTSRIYPIPIASNVLGYIGRVSPAKIKSDSYYHQNDNIGKTGIEKTFETYLRGKKGYQYVYKNVHNQTMGQYKDGEDDLETQSGANINLTLDSDLQQYAESLMQNKRGAVVAIEPKSGELLALVSSPTYDPNLMVGRQRSKHYGLLEQDSLIPLFDRSLIGQYPPGSTFKLVNALIALEEGVISPNTTFSCHHGWRYSPKLKVGCHAHRSPLALKQSIAQSCNAYYCSVFQRLIDRNNTTKTEFKTWETYVRSFGLGNYLNNDLHVGQPGHVPNVAYYDAKYPHLWKSPTVITLSIGQDALLTTPIQMANMCAAIANRGFFYTPHILKSVENHSEAGSKFKTKKEIDIKKRHFEAVIDGMQAVVEGKKGTAKNARLKGLSICGKTGTAENFKKINGEIVQLKDHSIFIAFAPKENPKIALAVYVENAGWGSSYASP